jgi:hypothetical protein
MRHELTPSSQGGIGLTPTGVIKVVPPLCYVASADNAWLYAATYRLVAVTCSGRSSLQAMYGFVEPNLNLSQVAAT